MYRLTSELTRKTCAFITRLDFPLITLGAILKYFSERGICVQSLQMQLLNPSEAVVTIQCQVDRDRIRHTLHGLEKISGVLELEMLESKGGSLIRI